MSEPVSITAQTGETWGGLEPVYVHNVRTSPGVQKPGFQKTKVMCYDGDITRLELNPALIKLYKWLDIGEQAYFLKFKGYTAYRCPSLSCELKTAYLPMIDCGPHHPWTSFKHVSRCESRIIEQLEFLEKKTPLDYISHVVLTSPSWVSEGLLDYVGGLDTLLRFKRAVHHFLKLLCQRLTRNHPDAQLAAWFGIHVWSSSRPLDKHLHAHLLLPNVSYNKKDRRFYRFNVKLDEHLVKTCWRDSLKRVGLWDAPDPALPDVYLQYYRLRVPPRKIIDELKDRAYQMSGDRDESDVAFSKLMKELPRSMFTELSPRVKHKIRYTFRFPLVDLNENLTADMLTGQDKRWASFLVHYTTRRLKAGFLLNLKRFGFISRKSTSARCPLCGVEMEKWGKICSNLPDLPHMILTREGKWEKNPPPFAPIEGQPDARGEDIFFKASPEHGRIKSLQRKGGRVSA